MNHALSVLILAAATVSTSGKPAPVAVYLEPIAEEAVQGFPVDKVEASLRERLARAKGLRMVSTAEDAVVVLRVKECVGWGEKKRVNEAEERNVAVNPKGGPVRNRGSEGVYGTRTEYRTQVVLVVRATWPEHFQDLQAADDDRTLKSAVGTVADELDGLVKNGLRAR